MTSRENILSRIKQAQDVPSQKAKVHKPDFMTDIYINSPENHIEVIFAENFKKNRGIFFYGEDIESGLLLLKSFLKEKEIDSLITEDEYLQALLNVAKVSHTNQVILPQSEQTLISVCDLMIARTGGILLVPSHHSTLQNHSQAGRHIIWAFSSQLVYDTQSALLISQEKYQNQLPPIFKVIHESTPSIHLLNSGLPSSSFHTHQELILFLIDDISEEFSNPPA